jgi:predicted ATPase with chaperone activity
MNGAVPDLADVLGLDEARRALEEVIAAPRS